MITHNLKIAWRNLMKYKMQNLISVVALAVGMVTIAATHYVLGHMRLPGYCYEPYGDRTYVMELHGLKDSTERTNPNVLSVGKIRPHILSALTNNGGLQSVEQIHIIDGLSTHGQTVKFILPDSAERLLNIGYFYMSPERMNFCGYRSAITGERIPVLKPRDAVMSETEARRTFGERNPIGAQIKFRSYIPPHEELTFTLRDVYKTESFADLDDKQLYIVYDEFGKGDAEMMHHSRFHVVLREGYTAEQLQQEANARLKSFRYGVELFPVDDFTENLYNIDMTTRHMVFLIGLFVLLSAMLGFVKMQTQLFRMRQREVTLRHVHGASFRSLFVLFSTEMFLSVAAASAISIGLAAWLTRSVEHYRLLYLEQYNLHEINLYPAIGLAVLGVAVLSLIVVCFVLYRMRSERRSLATGLHRNASHAMRNTMLCMQLGVCIFFLSSVICMSKAIDGIRQYMNVPEDESRFKNSLHIVPFNFSEKKVAEMTHRLTTEIKGIKRMVSYTIRSYRLEGEPKSYIDAAGITKFGKFYKAYSVTDTAILDFWQRPIKWLVPPGKREGTVLIEDSAYREIMNKGLIVDGTIHLEDYPVLPIGGTYAFLPYNKSNHQYTTEIVVLSPHENDRFYGRYYIIEAEEGRYQQVMDDLKSMMQDINPRTVKTTVMNLRDFMAKDLIIFEVIERLAWILSAVCLIICLMGIWSSIALDTRSRQKEVAIRKVHGAKHKDIALLFGRLYLWLMVVATIFSAPFVGGFTTTLSMWIGGVIGSYSPARGVLLQAVGITALVTLTIISVHIRKVMKVNPAEIIAKE